VAPLDSADNHAFILWYTEVITSTEDRTHFNTLVYSSWKGSIRLVDLRQSALCDTHSPMWVLLFDISCFLYAVYCTLRTCGCSIIWYLLSISSSWRFEQHGAPGSRSFFHWDYSINFVHKFSKDGRHILSRDYMTLKVCTYYLWYSVALTL
jgi:serine/threonine-protein phosphatase 2A regulatory subunit B